MVPIYIGPIFENRMRVVSEFTDKRAVPWALFEADPRVLSLNTIMEFFRIRRNQSLGVIGHASVGFPFVRGGAFPEYQDVLMLLHGFVFGVDEIGWAILHPNPFVSEPLGVPHNQTR